MCISDLVKDGVKRVRVHFADLLGASRCKVIPITALERACEDGLNFCVSVLATTLAGGVPKGTGLGEEVHYRDMQAVPDLSTLRALPWEPHSAVCLADLRLDGEPLPCSPRGILRRAAAAAGARGLRAVCGHELEFFLLERVGDGWRQRTPAAGMVYRMDRLVDPDGVVRAIEDAVDQLGIPLLAVNQEFDGSQWEINYRHGDALEAADNAHLLKLAVKEVAAMHGLVATFMGKPLDRLGTSGYHLHLSLWDENGANRFVDGASADGLSDLCRWFVAGQLEHAAGMSALLGPTINAYRRYAARTFGPHWVNWGSDNRTALVRVPGERGDATRIENRGGDGTASPYLVAAAAILAGLDGIDRRLDPGQVASGDSYAVEGRWLRLPASLELALDALQADAYLCDHLGEQFVRCFVALKRDEVERFAAAVTEWEREEYLTAL